MNPLDELAERYRRRTEAFDRTVCTGPIGPDGGILPANGRESSEINRNARRMLEQTLAEGERLGFDRYAVQEAISHWRPRE